MAQIIIGGQNIQKLAQFKYGRGMTYRAILDLAKQGKVPISVEFCDKNRTQIVRELPDYLPVASNLHGSYAPPGCTFRDANSKYGSLYDGYHVSEDSQTGEKILFPLAKKLPDAKGNEVIVADAKDSIILVKLDFLNGKPTIEYEHDANKNETLVYLNTTDVICVAFPSSNSWYELKDNVFVKPGDSNSNINFLWRLGENWNGIFGLGVNSGNYYDGALFANNPPSYCLGMLSQ